MIFADVATLANVHSEHDKRFSLCNDGRNLMREYYLRVLSGRKPCHYLSNNHGFTCYIISAKMQLKEEVGQNRTMSLKQKLSCRKHCMFRIYPLDCEEHL